MALTARESIGKNIRTFRKLRNISQVDLARTLGYTSTGTLSQIETGARGIDMDKLPALAEGLEVPIAALVSNIDMTESESKLFIKLLYLIKNKDKSDELQSYYFSAKQLLG